MANGAGTAVADSPKPKPAAPPPQAAAEPEWQDFNSGEQGWEDFKGGDAAASTKQPSLLDRVSEGVGHAFQSVGLPHDLTDIPRWSKHMVGQDFPEGYKPTLKERIVGMKGKPTPYPGRDIIEAHHQAGQESMVGYLPGGAGAVDAAKSWREGRYEDVPGDVLGGVAELSPLAHPTVVEGANTLKGKVGEWSRTPEGELKPGIEYTSRLMGMGAGYEAGSGLGHPWIGGAAGAELGPRLVDRVIPDRPPAKPDPFDTSRPDWTPKQGPFGSLSEEQFEQVHGKKIETAEKTRLKEIIDREKMFEQDAASRNKRDSGKGKDKGDTAPSPKPSAPPSTPPAGGKPKMSAKQVKEAGISAAGKPRLSELMQRRVDDAESRYGANRAARLTRQQEEAQSQGQPERRVNSSLREAVGPNQDRANIVRDARKIIDDPRSTTRDKRIAQDRIDDIMKHPFESKEDEGLTTMQGSKKERLLSKVDAEKKTADRAKARTKRFSKPEAADD